MNLFDSRGKGAKGDCSLIWCARPSYRVHACIRYECKWVHDSFVVNKTSCFYWTVAKNPTRGKDSGGDFWAQSYLTLPDRPLTTAPCFPLRWLMVRVAPQRNNPVSSLIIINCPQNLKLATKAAWTKLTTFITSSPKVSLFRQGIKLCEWHHEIIMTLFYFMSFLNLIQHQFLWYVCVICL